MGLNINSFNWKQIFNDNNGKTTGLLLWGNVCCGIGAGGFFVSGNTIMVLAVYAAITKTTADAQIVSFMTNLLTTSFGLIVLSMSALGLDRSVKDKSLGEDVVTEKPKKEETV